MEVTEDNFGSACQLITEALPNADFISIDGEFSGLSTIKGRSVGYDTLAENYSKLRRGSNKFLLIQYGICLFTWDNENSCYEAMPFSFYIYPRPYKRWHNDVMFTCQSSSLDFLAKNGFDFNKLFSKGISFMSPWEEERARIKMEKDLNIFSQSNTVKRSSVSVTWNGSYGSGAVVFIPKDQKEFVTQVSDKVAAFMRDNSEKIIDLPPCTAFQRKLLYESLSEKYPTGLYLQNVTDANDQRIIRGVKVSAQQEAIKNKREKEEEALKEIIGFTKVMKMLSDSRKPIIGHNMIMDVFLTVTNFFAHPPEELKEYKNLVQTVFPMIFDTKLMANTQPISSRVAGTSLKDLTERVEEKQLPDPNVVYSKKLDDQNKSRNEYHQAGYDAYCTGIIFISLSKCLYEYLDMKCDRVDLSSEIMKPFSNRINLTGIKDIQYVDMSRPDIPPDRTAVFYVKCPSDWRFQDLENLFSPFSNLSSHVVWLGDGECYVTINNPDKADTVIQNLVLKRDINESYFVVPYSSITPQGVLSEDNPKLNDKLKRKRNNDGELLEEPNQKRNARKNSWNTSSKKEDVEDGEISSEEEDVEKEGNNTERKPIFELTPIW